jgi:hypothetical protein
LALSLDSPSIAERRGVQNCSISESATLSAALSLSVA